MAVPRRHFVGGAHLTGQGPDDLAAMLSALQGPGWDPLGAPGEDVLELAAGGSEAVRVDLSGAPPSSYLQLRFSAVAFGRGSPGAVDSVGWGQFSAWTDSEGDLHQVAPAGALLESGGVLSDVDVAIDGSAVLVTFTALGGAAARVRVRWAVAALRAGFDLAPP